MSLAGARDGVTGSELEQFALVFIQIPYAHLRKSPALRAAPFSKGGFRGFWPAENHTGGNGLVHSNENRSSDLGGCPFSKPGRWLLSYPRG